MSPAIELDANPSFSSELDTTTRTGVFHGHTEPPVLRIDMTAAIALPYREARRQAIDAFEIEYARAMLDRCEGNVTRCARAAGLDRVYLHRLLRKHGLRGSLPPAPPSEPVPEELG